MLIFLTGFMGAGKTTAGKKMAAMLNFGFIDLDQLIESETQETTDALFEKGESRFREIEAHVLRSTLTDTSTVIATGGGTPCFKDNMQWMNEHGITVYLKLAAGSLYHRLAVAKKKRPLLKGKGDVALMEYIMETLAWREPYYRQAKYIFKGENLVVTDVIEVLKKSEPQLR